MDRKETQQSTLKEINPEYSLAGLMLKLKVQYFGLLMRRTKELQGPRVHGPRPHRCSLRRLRSAQDHASARGREEGEPAWGGKNKDLRKAHNLAPRNG